GWGGAAVGRQPGLGRLDAPAGTVEELRPEPLLERAHLEADRGLGDPESLGGDGEAAPLDHCAERRELPRVHNACLYHRSVDRELRTTFDEVADLYARARPTYPDEVFDDLVEAARLGVGARVLELGSGTGIATLPLARRGFELVCVELGAQLAAVARRKLEAFANVEIVNAAFESWSPPGRFDAVVAFASFHWNDPAARYERSANALRPGGALAVVRADHVLPADGGAV